MELSLAPEKHLRVNALLCEFEASPAFSDLLDSVDVLSGTSCAAPTHLVRDELCQFAYFILCHRPGYSVIVSKCGDER